MVSEPCAPALPHALPPPDLPRVLGRHRLAPHHGVGHAKRHFHPHAHHTPAPPDGHGEQAQTHPGVSRETPVLDASGARGCVTTPADLRRALDLPPAPPGLAAAAPGPSGAAARPARPGLPVGLPWMVGGGLGAAGLIGGGTAAADLLGRYALAPPAFAGNAPGVPIPEPSGLMVFGLAFAAVLILRLHNPSKRLG